VGSPALDTALQMGPHWGRVEGKENLPRQIILKLSQGQVLGNIT